jgi:hypothetical protein
MKKLTMTLSTLALCLLGTGSAIAAGYPWKGHAQPYVFLFGNDIDTHQQTRLTSSGDLFGFFYVKFSGDVTSDGYPVASHVNCNDTLDCTVGWHLRAKPGAAIFLYHAMPDHPVWLVNRSDIPQPGAYAHFHWLGEDHPMPNQPPMDGYLLELQAVDSFCFVHHGTPIDPEATCQDNGGVPVAPGLDIATHVNIVTSFPD